MPEAQRIGGPFDIVHLAFTAFPADTRVKREALATTAIGERVAVVAFRLPDQLHEEDLGALRVIRLPGRKSRRGPLRYLSEYGSFVWRCRRLLSRDPRFRQVRVVHIHTLPDFLVWAATPARQRGARLILDLHEIFPEFAATKYPGFAGRIAARAGLWIERFARGHADVTITVNRPIDELLATRLLRRPERRVVIHNSADPDDFGDPAAPVIHTRPRLELIYHGSLTRLYGLDVAIRGVALAASRGIPVHFTILGDGHERHELVQLRDALAAQGAVSFEASIPQRALRARLRAADAGVVPTLLDAMTRYSLSNKLLEYVHLGVPVLAARLPSYASYLSAEATWYWQPGDAESLAAVISDFSRAGPETRSARAACAQRDLATIAWPHERERLIATYRSLLEG